MKNEESEIIRDENNDIIQLVDDNGKQHPFEVVLHVPYEEKHYVILHPLDDYPGLDEDTCVIFELIEQEGSDTATLIPETDDDILDTIYALYVEWATEEEKKEQNCSGNCSSCPGCPPDDAD